MLKIIKIGGKLIEDETTRSSLCHRLSSYYPHCVLVHGGGSMAAQLSARLGIVTRMYEGRRITDRETLEVTIMAYAGLANKMLVAGLQAWGMDACGLSGCDMGVVCAHKREVKEMDWGYVGDIDKVNAGRLNMLLEQKIMPVISPITFEPGGQLLNTNADSVAGAVAVAMSRLYATELVFCMDKPGVLRDVEDVTSVIARLDREEYHKAREQGFIHSGMLPKLENAFQTLEAGVTAVRLTDIEHLEGGTVVQW